METPTPTTELIDSRPLLPVQWSAPTHPIHTRGRRWYAYASLAVIVLAGYGIVTGAWTFSLAILIGAGVFFLLREAPPIIKTIKIEEGGFSLDGSFTGWKDCAAFWIVKTPAYTELHIRRKTGANRETVIQIGDFADTEIRACISPFLQEQSDRRERLVDRLIRIFKL